MCELLGMSANVPTDICFSFTGLMERGGRTGPHKDGWGMAMYRQGQVWTIHDPRPSAHSEMAEIMSKTSVKCDVVISHIRQANVGQVCLPNTHPFSRQLWGKTWTFAHNGQLESVTDLPLSSYHPAGTTDSEWAFCWMMGLLSQGYPQQPTIMVLSQAVAELSKQLQVKGVFNMMLSDGEYLFCFCGSKLHWLTRRAPFQQAVLADNDLSINFSQVTTDKDVVTVIATQPLTCNEAWKQMTQGECLVFKDGDVVMDLL